MTPLPGGPSSQTDLLIGEITRLIEERLDGVREGIRAVPGLAEDLHEVSLWQASLRGLNAARVPTLEPLEQIVIPSKGVEPAMASREGMRSIAETADGNVESGLRTIDAMRRVMTNPSGKAWGPSDLAKAMVEVGWKTQAGDQTRLVTSRLQKLLITGRVTRPEQGRYVWSGDDVS